MYELARWGSTSLNITSNNEQQNEITAVLTSDKTRVKYIQPHINTEPQNYYL